MNLLKKIFKSKTAITSVATFITAAIGIISQLTHGIFGMVMPKEWIAILTVVGIVLSEVFNHFFPSGNLIGTGQNWSTPKWIGMIATALIATLLAITSALPATWALFITASIIPVLQLIVRIFGGATEPQVEAAEAKGLPTGGK